MDNETITEICPQCGVDSGGIEITYCELCQGGDLCCCWCDGDINKYEGTDEDD